MLKNLKRDSLPYKTTFLEKLTLLRILIRMTSWNLNKKFLWNILEIAWYEQGLFDLVSLWDRAIDDCDLIEAQECIIDIKKAIEDWKRFNQ